MPNISHLTTFKWLKNPKARLLAIFLIVNILINKGIFFFLIFGSGIFPVSGWLLLLIALVTSLGMTLLLSLFRRGTKVGAVLLTVISICICFPIFGYFVNSSIKQAKLYAEKLVPEIEAIHKSTGHWPTDLAEIPADRKPILNESMLWPLLAYKRDGIYISIGGVFINYASDDEPPNLSVGRRDTHFFWDWEKARWRTLFD